MLCARIWVVVSAELVGNSAAEAAEAIENDSEEIERRGKPARPNLSCHQALRSQLGSKALN